MQVNCLVSFSLERSFKRMAQLNIRFANYFYFHDALELPQYNFSLLNYLLLLQRVIELLIS
jgi:hypothetical protein